MGSPGHFYGARSFWFGDAPAYDPSPPLRGERRADVAVLGGGINGLSTALHLRRADPACTVALLEGEVIGFGASGRNAGQLIVAFGGGDLARARRRLGASQIAEGWSYVHRGLVAIEEFIASEGIDVDYAQTGFVEAALAADRPGTIDAFHDLLVEIGQSAFVTALSGSEMAQAFNSPYLGGGMHDRRGGQLHPLKLVRGLKRAAERAGARIYENSPVARIETAGPGIVLETGTGRLRCERLVLATNAYTHLLEGLAPICGDRLQRPLIVHASVTEPLSAQQWEAVGWTRRCGVNVLSDLFYSFAPTADGRLVYVSGYHVGVPEGKTLGPEVNLRFLKEGHAHLEQFFPALRGLRTVQSWGGPISITPDYLPGVGVSRDPRILYAIGCWGHGLPIGMQNGQALADLVLDRITQDSAAWFVQRPARLFPPAAISSAALRGARRVQRAANRRKALKLDPPLRFG